MPINGVFQNFRFTRWHPKYDFFNFSKRMFTVQPDMSENVQQYLNEIDLWHWNPFRLNHLTGNRCLHFTMMKLWQRYNFSQRFKIAPQVLMAYCDILEEHYQIVSHLWIFRNSLTTLKFKKNSSILVRKFRSFRGQNSK